MVPTPVILVLHLGLHLDLEFCSEGLDTILWHVLVSFWAIAAFWEHPVIT